MLELSNFLRIILFCCLQTFKILLDIFYHRLNECLLQKRVWTLLPTFFVVGFSTNENRLKYLSPFSLEFVEMFLRVLSWYFSLAWEVSRSPEKFSSLFFEFLSRRISGQNFKLFLSVCMVKMNLEVMFRNVVHCLQGHVDHIWIL